MTEWQVEFHHEREIPPHFVERGAEKRKTDRPKEKRFLDILKARGLPLPLSNRHRVGLGSGPSTVAEFTWPEKKILVFIDDKSARLYEITHER